MVNPDVLRACPALADLPGAAIEALAERGHEVTFEKGERLVPLLEPPARLLFLLEGLAKMTAVSANGIERIVYVFRPGDITGSRILLEESPEAAHEIVAMHRVRAVSVTKPDALRIGQDHPDLLLAITRSFSERINDLTDRMLAAMSTEVPVRLSGLLIDFADDRSGSDELVPLTHRLTHESMAQIIGASRPHTSTVLRDLEALGAVQRRSSRGLLVNPRRLHEIATSGEMPEIPATAAD